LCETGQRHRKIADISFEVGFKDLSYFNRTFRRKYGATPSDMRLAAGGAREPL
jgi:AraC-like DNA-binding protein